MRNIETYPVANVTKPAKERRVSKRVCHAIDLLVSGQCRTQKEAAEKAGLTRERFCRALKESHVIGRLELAVKRQLATSQAPAAATLLRLLTEAKSEHVMKDSATTLLGINGYHANPRGPVVSVGIQHAGYVVNLATPGNPDVVAEIGECGGIVRDSRPTEMTNVTPEPEDE